MHHRLNTLAPTAFIRFGGAAPSKTGGRRTLFRPTRARPGEVWASTAEVVEPAPVFRIMPATPHDVPHPADDRGSPTMKSCALCAWPPRATFAPRCSGPVPPPQCLSAGKRRRWSHSPCFSIFSIFLGRKALYLEDLFVRPSYRRGGYGRALLIHLVRIAVDRGCGRFEWAVLGWNAPAIPFYQSLEAGVVRDWRIVRLTGPALAGLATAAPEGS
jgi:GNAT superfamily N-acetyltransferase